MVSRGSFWTQSGALVFCLFFVFFFTGIFFCVVQESDLFMWLFEKSCRDEQVAEQEKFFDHALRSVRDFGSGKCL